MSPSRRRWALVNVIASRRVITFGGVVPEVASRHHGWGVITACIENEARNYRERTWQLLLLHGPSWSELACWLSAAKAFAWAHGVPLILPWRITWHSPHCKRLKVSDTFGISFVKALLVSSGHKGWSMFLSWWLLWNCWWNKWWLVKLWQGWTCHGSGVTDREIDELAHRVGCFRAIVGRDNLGFILSFEICLYQSSPQCRKGESVQGRPICFLQAAVMDLWQNQRKPWSILLKPGSWWCRS